MMYVVSFIFREEREKSYKVHKKTKKIDKIFFVPKSIVLNAHRYKQTKRMWKDCEYTLDKIHLSLPEWYCKKELGFYA